MKTIKLLSALVLTLFLTGCSSDDSGSRSIDGTWNLTNIKGGIEGIDNDFANGTITWTFDSDAGTVEVVNSNTNDVEDMLPTGTYSFTIEASEIPDLCEENFFIDAVNFGCYHITTHHLTFGQVESDGYLISLVR